MCLISSNLAGRFCMASIFPLFEGHQVKGQGHSNLQCKHHCFKEEKCLTGKCKSSALMTHHGLTKYCSNYPKTLNGGSA